MSLRRNAHAVIIGINEYQDEKIPKLQFARADAEGVYQILTDPELGRISKENVILLLDEKATQQEIRSAIGDEIPRRAGEQDLVYVYFAGHGLPFINPKSGSADGMEKYLVPVDAKLDRIRGTGIPMDDIQRFFGYIQSKQVMFFIDSCFSGEAGGRTFQNPAFQTRHGLLTPEFLDNLSGEGRLVVTACDVNELSIETSKIGHGLFTHYLMEGLKGNADKDQDGLVTIHELYDYVYDHVSQHARKLGGSMHPIQKGSIKGKIPLTVYETATQKQAKELHTQAQVDYQLGKFNEAYDSWQRVVQLVPEHEAALRGLTEIENRRQDEKRKKQEILEHKQRVLLNLFRDGQLPSEEFDAAMELIEKSDGDLTALERETRRLLDALVDRRISAASYGKSVRLLRKPAAPEPLPKLEKAPPVAAKSKPEKIPEAKPAAPKTEPPIEKVKPVDPGVELKKTPVLEEKKNLPALTRRKWTIVVSAALGLIGVVIVIMVLYNRVTYSEEQVKAMLVKNDFYDSRKNPTGKGITHNYVEQTLSNDKVVLDKTTGLMWQQSGSPNDMVYADAEKYLRELNNKPFAGFTDWRLPTLEEAMSLMETQKKNGDLYIDAKFDQTQRWIWTADKYSASVAWVAGFYVGGCDYDDVAYDGGDYVRAVRSVQPELPQQQATSESIIGKSIVLRKTPTTLSEEQAKTMLVEKNFYGSDWNKDGKGITHNYVEQTLNGDKVVLDKATGLMWQQSGSSSIIVLSNTDAEKYIRELNNKSFAGFLDWRLPTLEEAMSLMETEKKSGDLYIDSKFDQMQKWIWTADKDSTDVAWMAIFNYGDCRLLRNVGNYYFVRAVR